MRLLESLPKIPEDRIIEIIESCIDHLGSLSPDFILTYDDFTFAGFYEATGCQGVTSLGYTDDGLNFEQVVRFNINMFREGLEDIYLNTIYHELLHVLVNKYMILNHIIVMTGVNQHAVVDEKFYSDVSFNEGHGGLWLEYAKRANELLNLVIPISSHCSDAELKRVFDASIDDYGEPGVEITCQDCNSSDKFLVANPFETPINPAVLCIYYDTINKNKNSFCANCNGTLYITIRDKEFKALMDAALKDYLDKIVLFKFFSQFA